VRPSEGAASRVSRPFRPKTSRGNFPDAEILTPQQGARPTSVRLRGIREIYARDCRFRFLMIPTRVKRLRHTFRTAYACARVSVVRQPSPVACVTSSTVCGFDLRLCVHDN
jgi:hypothetical protein